MSPEADAPGIPLGINHELQISVAQPYYVALKPLKYRAVESSVIKRSIVLEHQKTSVSLEDVFWNALKHIAEERRETLSKLVGSIYSNRQSANLSSAIRVYVLWYYKDKVARQRVMFERRSRKTQGQRVPNLDPPRS
jgi:predicted DNA-binding ribbon-helix-helix protein